MIAQRHEEIEEELRATSLHLHLHRAASLESAPRADDESEVVCSKFAVGVGCISVGVAGGEEDG